MSFKQMVAVVTRKGCVRTVHTPFSLSHAWYIYTHTMHHATVLMHGAI